MKDGHKVVDIHNHFYTKTWLNYLTTRTEDPRFEWTGPTSGLLKGYGIVMGHSDKADDWDIDVRLKGITEVGVDIQLLTHTAPSAEITGSKELEWVKRINDELAGYCQKYPDRFIFSASVPLGDIKEAPKEMQRATKELGAKGFQMYSNINGELPSSERFYPIYEVASELGMVIQIHPALVPLTADAMKKAGLPFQLYGFTMDTTIALTSMIFQGVFDKFPKLKIHHCHLGGMAPYMMGRVDNAYKRFKGEHVMKGDRLPSETYKEHVYLDTLSMFPPAIKLALEYMGPEHLMFGSDWPHRASGTVPGNMETLDKVGLTKEQEAMIYGKNAMKVFNVK
jgi:aminocarboxymuconate-semialdehyde decarboxylase